MKTVLKNIGLILILPLLYMASIFYFRGGIIVFVPEWLNVTKFRFIYYIILFIIYLFLNLNSLYSIKNFYYRYLIIIVLCLLFAFITYILFFLGMNQFSPPEL